MEIRAEKPEDVGMIRQVNIAAFGQENEANLVDRLRGVTVTFSFVALQSNRAIGHVFFSPISVEGESTACLSMLGLAPIAVLPEYQRQGIGSLLIRQSLAELTRLDVHAIFVLGHPKYYPRFGFIPAKQKGFKCEYLVSDEAFMVLELANGRLDGCSGTVKYRSEFSECL